MLFNLAMHCIIKVSDLVDYKILKKYGGLSPKLTSLD
jgi:hypothetical protein